MDLPAEYIARVRAGERCCAGGKIVEFVSGHLCVPCAPPELRAVALSDAGTWGAVQELKALIPDWESIQWQKGGRNGV